MQRLQRVLCRQTVQFLEPNTLRPSAICGPGLLFQKQEKTEHQRVHRRPLTALLSAEHAETTFKIWWLIFC